MSSRKQIQAVFFSVLMVMSVVAMGAGGAAAQPLAANTDAEDLDSIHESIDTEISPQLETAEGETTLLLSVDRQIDLESTSQVSGETLQADSEVTLSPVADRIDQFQAAEVTDRYWVGNVLAVQADLSTHSVEEFAGIPGVTSISANIEAELPSQPSVDAAVSSDTQITTEQNHNGYTYGLEQIDVPGFEQQFNASGEGASVVVIDDGISNPEAGHPDLEFATKAVATDGEITTGTLGSPGAHGEHVAGTVAGAANPAGDVPRYGVAPNASLTKINAFEEGAYLNDLLASVQYAVENDADVASMSLGFPSPDGRSTAVNLVTDQMQEANEAGTIVVVSAGNSGSLENPDSGGPVTSPAAEFNSFAVGASVMDTPTGELYAGSQGDIGYFSSGAVINKRSVVDPTGNTFDYPATYPREYVQPDVSAPGLFVLSAGPLGSSVASENATYSEASGTSMAAPHVTGAIALVQSATAEDLGPKELEAALVETAEKPVNNFTELNSRDIRYGTGIINVTAATMAASSDNLEVSGTVTDSDDDPIVGATIESDEGALTTSNTTGAYTLQSTSSATNVTADAFGYAAETVFVNDSSTVDFQLNDSLELDLIQGQPDRVETGGSFDVVVDAGSLDNLTVDLSNESTFRVSENDLTLLLNGEEIPFGETIEFEDRFTGTATLTVEVDHDADISSGDELILNHTFAGAGDEAEVTTGPSEIIDTTGAADSVEIDADIVGTVNDEPTTTVTATGLVSDGEPSDGQKVTFTIGGEPVATAQTDDGTATAEVKAESIDLAPQENVTVDIEEFDVADTDEVNLVHETADLEEGFNLLSVPQPATLSTEDVDSLNVWNSGDQTYETVTDSTFDSAADLNDGLYVQATSDDARVGFTFDDDVPAGGTQDINPGWNLVGSNFAIDSNAEGPTVSIEDDLTGVDASALDLFRSDFSEFLDPSDQVDAYDAYWAYNPAEEADERGVTSSPYSVDDRRTVLEQGAPFFNVSVDDVELTSIEDADDRGLLEDRDVVGDSEQAVIVTATVDNEGTGHDVQFANLELTSIEQTVQFERVDRTGVDLEPDESETVTLSYIASQDDTSPFPDAFVPDDLAIEVNTEDASATAGAAFDDGGVDLDPQALTSDGEFIVNNVDVAGDGTVELRDANGDVLDSETFTSGINDGVIFDDIDTSSVAVGDELTVQVVDDDNSVLASDDAIVLQSTDVSAVDQESFALVNETVDFNAFIGNNALEPETEDVEFEVELNGEVVANETREDVELGNDGTTETITVDTQAIGAELNDTVTVTATAVGSGDSDSETRTVAESTLTFNEQALNADGEVLVEDVTADDDQQIVITDTEFNTVASVNVNELSGNDRGIDDATVAVDVSGATPGPHIAHVVADDYTVDGEGPNLVNDRANVLSASVEIADIDNSTVNEATLPVDVVTEVDVDTTVIDNDGDRDSNYTVEIRQDGDVIGESDNLSDDDTTTIELNEPVTKESASDEMFSIDAVLVDQTGEAFQTPAESTFETVSDTETFTVNVTDAEPNVVLPDQELSAANGADAVFVDDVTAEAGQFVVITAADDNSEILGATEIESTVAGEDNVIVGLDENISVGQYRAHIATDTGLAPGDQLVSDTGTVFEATVAFDNQTFVGSTDEVTVATADLLDGAESTEFEVAISNAAGDIIGTTGPLTGANEDVTVSLTEDISEDGEYVATLRFADGSSISDGTVADSATVTIEPTEASYQLSDLEPNDATVGTDETFTVSATVTNTGDLAGNQTVELALDGQVVATETNVELAGGDATTVTFEGVSVSEVGEFTHTVSTEDDSVSGSLTVVAEEITFNDQSTADSQVLVEDVTTTTPNQSVVITNSEFEIVGESGELGMVVQEDVLITLDDPTPPGEYIAHVVENADNVGSNGPNLVTDQATLVDSAVSVDNVSVDETEENLSVSVDEITVQTANVTDAETDGTNFTVELRQNGDVIGESDTLNGSNSDVTISLDDPIEATSTGTVSEDITAVLVDETGTAFQEPDVDQTAFQDVADDATVTITVSPADASVSLPDQEIGAANGSDAVYATDVTGAEGQYVVITDGDRNIIGATELDDRAAGDQVIVELDETVTRGEYRAHLTTDVGLLGGNALITDTGELYDATVNFEDQEFVGATEEVTVATAELLDGGDNTTNFAVAIHETENGSVGDIIGNTTGLNGTESDVTVALDDGESISENGEYVAMLHFDDGGDLGVPIQAVEDTSTVAPVTDSATITSIEGALNFNDQSFNATDGNVVVEDVQANETSTLLLTYTDADGNLTIAGIGSDSYGNATPNDLEVPVDNTSGFPGEHTAHLIPTDEVSDLGNYSAGDEVSDATAANVTTSATATVFDTALTIEDQSVEDSTESVTVATADLFDDVENGSDVGATEFGVAIHEVENGSTGGIIGFTGGLTANNSDVSVSLDREINSTEDVVAMLHVSDSGVRGAPITEYDGSSLAPVTNEATITVQQAEGGNVDLREQAVGTNGEVLVENVTAVDVVTVNGSAPATDAFDPAEDFLVLTDGSGVNDGSAGVIDSIQLSNVSGDIQAGTDVTLNAPNATPGEHTVVLHEPNADGDAPDPTAPRTNASSGEIVDASATVLAGDVAVSDQTLVEDQDPLDTITLDTAELDDGSADGATFTVVVENSSNNAELGNTTVTGSTTTVELDEALPRGDTDITVRLEQAGAPVEQAPAFSPITSSATVTTEQSQFDLTLNAVNGNTPGSAEVAEGTETVNVSVDVTNNGDFDDAQAITAQILDNGTEVASDSFSSPDFQVQQGETRTLVLEDLSTGGLAPGTYDVNVSSDDDEVSGELTVLAPNAELEGLSIGGSGSDAELTLAETTQNIDVTVNNTGDIEYTGNVTLTVSNASGTQISEEQSVGSVGADTTQVETFADVVVGNLSQGEYDVTVESDDDTTTGTLTVLAVEVRNLDIDGNGSTLTIDEGDGPVTVSAQLENFNSDFEERDVSLTVGDNELTDSFAGFQFSAGETRTIDFSDVAVQDLTAGDYDVTIATPQTNATGTLQVDNLAVDINTADSTLNVIDNETAVVNTTLTNEGDSPVTQTIELNVTGVSGAQDQQQVTVDGGNSTTIDLSYQTNQSDDGATVIVTSDQESAEETLSVQSLQDALPADDGSLTLDATTYAENITISANNTTITGAGTGATIIDGNVTIDGDNNTIEDLTIEGNLTDTGQNNSVGNAVITSNSPGGSIIIEGTDASISNTQAENVTVNGSATITDSTVSNSGAGSLTVTSSGDATVSGSSADAVSNAGNVTLSNTSADTVSSTGTTTYGSNTVLTTASDAVFNTVQGAVDASAGGDTVTVENGTYEETVTVATTGLTIEEASNADINEINPGAGVVVRTNTSTSVSYNGILDAVNAANTDETVKVGSGVTFTPNGTNSENKRTLSVEGLTLEGPNAGIDGNSSDRGTEAVIEGPLMIGADNITVDGFEIRDTNANSGGTLPGPGAVQLAVGGAYGDTADGATVRNNVITAGTNDNSQNAAVVFDNVAGVTIEQNLIQDGGNGVDILFGGFGTNDVTIQNNTDDT